MSLFSEDSDREMLTPFSVFRLNSRDIYWGPLGMTSYSPDPFYPTTNVIDTEYGTLSTGKAVVTFKNINLRDIVGAHVWDSHDIFRLTLRQFNTLIYSQGGAGTTTFASVFDARTYTARRNISVYCSGLTWHNCGHSIIRKNNRGSAFLTTISNYTDVNADGLWTTPDTSLFKSTTQSDEPELQHLLFRKTQNMVNLQFGFAPEYTNTINMSASNGMIAANKLFLVWDFSMQFQITPVS